MLRAALKDDLCQNDNFSIATTRSNAGLCAIEVFPSDGPSRCCVSIIVNQLLTREAGDWQDASTPSTSSKVTIDKIRRWVANCDSHTICGRWSELNSVPTQLPTRLLKLSQTSTNPDVCLVHTVALRDVFKIQYTTLSHCWGRAEHLQLTERTFSDFEDRIPWDDLSKTFQDAITVTLKLGYSYIWIDALCIIQKNIDDWQQEAASMAAVYANGSLNIAATDAHDGSEGLFRERDLATLCRFVLPLADSDYMCYSSDWNARVTRAPLNSRAWVLQERILAPRVLHFSADQVRWECAQLLASECLPDDFNGDPDDYHCFRRSVLRPDLDDDPSDPLRRYRSWYQIAEIFSRCRLSVPSDMPVAIAGLARSFCHHLRLDPKAYLCGLWRPRFVEQLAWMRWQPPTGSIDDYPHGCSDKRLPSWTWLSMYAPCRTYDSRHLHNIAEVVDVRATPEGDDFGAVTSTICRMRGPLCHAKLQPAVNPSIEHPVGSIVLGDDELSPPQHRYLLRLDDISAEGLQRAFAGPVYLLLLNTYFKANVAEQHGIVPWPLGDHTNYVGGVYQCLILAPAGTSNRLRRLGFVAFGISLVTRGALTFDVREPMPRETCCTLDRHFRTDDLPHDLFESVDDEHMYAFDLV